MRLNRTLWQQIEEFFENLFDKKDRGKFYGKYKAFVRDNQDPLKLGRIRAEVPAVLGVAKDENQWSMWALPCVPYAGKNRGMLFTPRVGDVIWVEFEEGNPARPIWTGMMWAMEDMPEEMKLDTPLNNVIETGNFRIELRDTNSEDDEIYPLFRIVSKITGSTLEFDETKEADKITLMQKSYDGSSEQKIEMDSTKDAEKINVVSKNNDVITMDCTSGSEKIEITEAINSNVVTMDSVGIHIMTDTGNASTKILINGEDRYLATEELANWCMSHQHMGNMGAPTPVFPTDLVTITAGILPGGAFLTNTPNKEVKGG